jgi:hypothetical protein
MLKNPGDKADRAYLGLSEDRSFTIKDTGGFLGELKEFHKEL